MFYSEFKFILYEGEQTQLLRCLILTTFTVHGFSLLIVLLFGFVSIIVSQVYFLVDCKSVLTHLVCFAVFAYESKWQIIAVLTIN